jgi:transcriptional regulator with XRE-family HTH domain
MESHTNERASVKAVLALAREGRWPTATTARELHRRCHVSMLRGYRLAHGWTLTETARRLREQAGAAGEPIPLLGHDRISRWETGGERPSARYLDALCRLYRSRPDLLGFGSDYAGGAGAARAAGDDDDPEREDDRMDRREVIRGLLTTAGAGLTASALHALTRTRQGMTATFEQGRASRATVNWCEERAISHGNAYRVVPPARLLGDAALDFDDIQRLLERRQSLDGQRRLTDAAARLAGLIGVLCIDLGEPRQASEWFHTGRLAAQETGDRALHAWLLTREALIHLYYGSPENAVQLARSARQLSGSTRCVAASMAPAVEARALARLGREGDAIPVLQHAVRVFEAAPDAGAAAGVFGFSEQKLRFYEGNVLARTRASAAAMRAQSRALSLYPVGDVVDRGHIHLDRAVTLIRAGDLAEACRSTSRVLLDLPPDAGIGALLAEAQEVRLAVPERHRTHLAVRELDEVIANRRAELPRPA